MECVVDIPHFLSQVLTVIWAMDLAHKVRRLAVEERNKSPISPPSVPVQGSRERQAQEYSQRWWRTLVGSSFNFCRERDEPLAAMSAVPTYIHIYIFSSCHRLSATTCIYPHEVTFSFNFFYKSPSGQMHVWRNGKVLRVKVCQNNFWKFDFHRKLTWVRGHFL